MPNLKYLVNYLDQLQELTGRKIQVVQDDAISSAAKLEVAEIHGRDFHLVRYKGGYPSLEHLIMHELVHLELIAQARKTEVNQLVVSDMSHRMAFTRKLEKQSQEFRRAGLPEETIRGYIQKLHDGMVLQAYNLPIDLFIEDILYDKFPDMRPEQQQSLERMLLDGVRGVTDPLIQRHAPPWLIRANKVYCMVGAYQVLDLFKVDLVKAFKPSKQEHRLARELWDEFLAMRRDREPGEEYNLLQDWAGDLDLQAYFQLLDEAEYLSKQAL